MLFKKIYYLMKNPPSLVLLVLISFSFTLQDKNCFAYFEGCFKNKQTYKIKIKNCKEGYMNEVDENFIVLNVKMVILFLKITWDVFIYQIQSNIAFIIQNMGMNYVFNAKKAMGFIMVKKVAKKLKIQ